MCSIFIIFILCGRILGTEGFARVAISANLKTDIQYTGSGWKKVVGWHSPPGTGHMTSSASLTNGDFKAATSGLYNVFATVTFSVTNMDIFKLAVFINNDEKKTHSGLFATFQNANGYKSLSVLGTVRLQAENTLSVYVYSEKSSTWTLIGSSESTFGVEFIGFFGYVPGFSSFLMHPQKIGGTEWIRVLRWRAYGSPGLFRSRTGFSEDTGIFVPICDGVYQISAVLRFSITAPGTFEMGINLNSESNGSIITHEEEQHNSTFTLSLSLGLKLKAGDEIALVVKGPPSFNIESDSSFSGILVNEGGSVPGFSTVFFAPVNGTGRTWVNIPLPKPTPKYGQFEAVEDSISSGKYYHSEQQIFTISALIYIEAASPTGIIMTLHSDGSSLTAMRTGVFTRKESGKSFASYSVTGILELPEDSPLHLFINLKKQEPYKILPDSRVSVTVSQQDYQAFHIISKSPLSISMGNTWTKVDNLVIKGTGSYSFTNKLKDGQYIAGVTGIYYLSANIIFQDANGPISIIISLNGDTSKRRSLYAAKGNPAANKESLSVSGALHIRKKETVSVYAMVEGDDSWSVISESTFSVVFIGQHFAVSGFSTVMARQRSVQQEGWVKVKNWMPQRVSGSMFSSGPGFDNLEGNYVIPHDGYYIVSTSLKIQDGSAKGSNFLSTITLDSNPARYTYQNGMQDYIEYKYSQVENDFYCLVTSGVIEASKGMNISVWLRSVGDTSYTVSQDSSLSIIYISPVNSLHASAASLMLDNGISQSERLATGWKTLAYWRKTRQNTAPGLFMTGTLIALDANAGSIYIRESGIYMVSVSVSIRASYLSNDDIVGDFEIALHTKNGPVALITKYTKTMQNIFSMKLFSVLYLPTETYFYVKVRSSTPSASWENLREHCSISIARIPPFSVPPSIISGLPEENRIPTKKGFWSRIRRWNVNKAPTQELSGNGFHSQNGYFTVEFTGIYFISSSLTISSNLTSFYVRMKIGLNGNVSLPGTNVIKSGAGPVHTIADCEKYCARPIAIILGLKIGDTIGVYVQSDAAYLDLFHSSSFTVKYLTPMNPLPPGFSMNVKETFNVDVYGDKQISGWDLKTNSGNYIESSGGDKNEYYILTSGLYLVSVNVEFLEVSGLAKAMPSINNIPALSATYHSSEDESFTISVTGVMEINAGSVFTVTVFTESDQNYKISDLSTSSMTYIGKSNTNPGFTATRNVEHLINLPASTWMQIKSWSTSGKDFLFMSGSGFESRKSYIVQESGFYFVSVNIIFLSSSNHSSVLELVLIHNNINNMDNGLYARSTINERGTVTLQINGGIYLGVWDFLEVHVRSSNEMKGISLKQESTFSILKIGEDLSAVSCADKGPNIVGQLIPDNIRLERGSDIAWNCYATGNAPTYQWSKNFKDISEAVSRRLELNALQVNNSGMYVCSATAGGVKASSNIATVTVFEPLPVFLNTIQEYTIETPENGILELELLNIKAKAESVETEFEEMTFEIIDGDSKQQFKISPLKSAYGTLLSRVKSLDREDIDIYHLQISALNLKKPNQPIKQLIVVRVKDLNDNEPIFEHRIYNVTIKEDITVGSFVTRVSATDKDIGENAVIRYSIVPGSARDVFAIDDVRGEIKLMEPIDREKRDEYVLFVKATDGEFMDFAELYITVADVNEHKPYFVKENYVADVLESIAPMVPFVHLLAEDQDSGENARIIYKIISGDPAKQFTVSSNGDLSVLTSIDYERNSTFNLIVSLCDSGNPPLYSDGNASIHVIVRNTNDNRPRFSKPKYSVNLRENHKRFEEGDFYVYASDPDGVFGQEITYRILEQENLTTEFVVSSKTGLVQINIAPDYEKKEYYEFDVEASDNDVRSPMTSIVSVLVTVIDENDNKPYFLEVNDEVTIIESPITERTIYTVIANDLDEKENGEVSYRIIGGNEGNQFYISPNTGEVRTQRPVDREEKAKYHLNISAVDNGNPSYSSSNTFLLTVNVKDSNDNAPEFDKSLYEVTVKENDPVNTTLFEMTVSDVDLNNNSKFEVSILESTLGSKFQVEYKSNNVYELVLKHQLNFEEISMYQFTLWAKDHGTPSLESSVPVTITVEDVNDHNPEFRKYFHTATLVDNPAENLTVIQLMATDKDVGIGQMSYEIVAGNDDNAFSVSKHTGIIRTNRKNSTFNPLYNLSIQASDAFPPIRKSPIATVIVRLSHIPAIRLEETRIGQYQFETTVNLEEFLHLTDIETLEISVQQYHPDEERLNTYSTEPPVPWYTVFVSTNSQYNRLRKWVALEYNVSILHSEQHKRKRRSFVLRKMEKIRVVIGNDSSCLEENGNSRIICNGPLAAGLAYRLQARVYEKDTLMPIESHFSKPVHLKPIFPAKATLKEDVADGMLALGASFGLVYVTMILVIVIYVCWKQTHQIVNVDHLRDNRGKFPMHDGNRLSPLHPMTSYFSPQTGRLQKFGGSDGNGLWPGMSMTEHNQMLQRSDGMMMSQDNQLGTKDQSRDFPRNLDNQGFDSEPYYAKGWDRSEIEYDDYDSLYGTTDGLSGNQEKLEKNFRLEEKKEERIYQNIKEDSPRDEKAIFL